MKLQEKLGKLVNKDIIIELTKTDEKGYNYEVKGTLIEIGEDYFVINEFDESGEQHIGEKIFTYNGILNIGSYR